MSSRFNSNETRRLLGDGGFSLVELVAVMVVVGIIAGTAAVSLSSTMGNRAIMAAKQLQRDLTFARQRAVATGTKSWVEFDTGAHSWTVKAEVAPGWNRGTAAVLTDPATNGDFVQVLDANQFIGVQLDSVNIDGDVWLGFDWLGRPLDIDDIDDWTPLPAHGSIVFTGGHQVTVEKDTGHIAYVPPP